MSKNKKFKPKTGPSYQRYFFAYSDKMIRDKLSDVHMTFCLMFGMDYFDVIPSFKNGLAVVEFPQTSGDVGGRYGVLMLPKDYTSEFMKKGPEHSVRKISPRVLDPAVNELVYLVNFDIDNDHLKQMGEDSGGLYENNVLLPYRLPLTSLPIDGRLVSCGYENVFSTPYIIHRQEGSYQFGPFGYSKVKKPEIFGVKQNPQIHIHRINAVNCENSICEIVLKNVKALPAATEGIGQV